MQNQTAMFAKVENSADMNKNLRGLINYPLGPYQIVTYADSGIEKLEDIKDRKVFLGPPAGAATKVMKDVVEAVTGLVPDEGYEAMRYDWSSAETAFLDGQMDVYIVPTSIPSPQIQQFALVAHFEGVAPLPSAEVHLLEGGFFAATTVEQGLFGVNLVLPQQALRARGERSWDAFVAERFDAAPAIAASSRWSPAICHDVARDPGCDVCSGSPS